MGTTPSTSGLVDDNRVVVVDDENTNTSDENRIQTSTMQGIIDIDEASSRQLLLPVPTTGDGTTTTRTRITTPRSSNTTGTSVVNNNNNNARGSSVISDAEYVLLLDDVDNSNNNNNTTQRIGDTADSQKQRQQRQPSGVIGREESSTMGGSTHVINNRSDSKQKHQPAPIVFNNTIVLEDNPFFEQVRVAPETATLTSLSSSKSKKYDNKKRMSSGKMNNNTVVTASQPTQETEFFYFTSPVASTTSASHNDGFGRAGIHGRSRHIGQQRRRSSNNDDDDDEDYDDFMSTSYPLSTSVSSSGRQRAGTDLTDDNDIDDDYGYENSTYTSNRSIHWHPAEERRYSDSSSQVSSSRGGGGGGGTVGRYNRSNSRNNSSSRRRRSRTASGTGGSSAYYNVELNGLNILNVVTYVFHLFVSWGVGVWGLHHIIETRWEVTMKYETLVVPAEYTSFYILALIMICESIFCIFQLLPYYRGRSVIQAGTKFYFFYTFCWQTAWTLFYSFRLFIVSFICMIGTLVSLILLLYSQEHHNSYSNIATASLSTPLIPSASISNGIGPTIMVQRMTSKQHHLVEYLLFRFPFYLHTGWMVCLSVNHFALLFRYYSHDNIGLHLAADIIALCIMLPVATYSLTRQNYDFVIPLTILLSYIGIGTRLLNPSDAMLNLYGPMIIASIKIASFSLAGVVALCVIPAVVIWFAHEFCTINVVELD